MKQETRSLLAVGLSVVVFLIWYGFFAPKQPLKPESDVPAATAQQPSAPSEATTPSSGNVTSAAQPATAMPGAVNIHDPQGEIPLKRSIIESDIYRIEFTNDGGVPVSWEMKNFKKNVGKEAVPVNLVTDKVTPLLEKFSLGGIPARPRYNVIKESADKIVYSWRGKEVAITKTYQFDPRGYMAEVSVAIRNMGQNPIESSLTNEWSMVVPKEEEKGFLGFLKGPSNVFNFIYYLDGKVSKDPVAEMDGHLIWAGLEDRYFLSAIVPRGHGETAKTSSIKRANEDGTSFLSTTVTVPKQTIVGSGEVVQKYSIYAGPKEMNCLKFAGASLDKSIDYGWFGFIAVPILYLLKFFYGIIHNYGVAIIILTVFAKLLMHPLSRHSMKSMKAMQNLQPKMKELREKYKDNKERLNVETMALFKANKVNPMGGCLPMLIQLPIYIALYKVLWNSIELYRAPFFWFYKDLSMPDPYFIMPVVLGFAMWLQQKLTPSASADPTQAKMMQIMPIMFTAFMLFLPSGLVLYILVNTGMGVAQQWMMNNDIRLRDLIRGRVKKVTA